MKEYIKVLNNYLSENPPEICKCQIETILDMFCCCYLQQWQGDTLDVRAHFEALDDILKELTMQQQDAVVDITCELCSLYRREAFHDGVLTGFRLFRELMQA